MIFIQDKEIGKVILIKDGKTIDYKLAISDHKLNKLHQKYHNKEVKYLAGSIENRDPETSKESVELYKKYLDKGYSVLRIQNRVFFDAEVIISFKAKVTAILPLELSKEDGIILYKLFCKFEASSNTDMFVENLYKKDNNIDYDYYTNNIYSNFKTSDVLKKFIKKKTNNLNDEEKIMFEKYENFNLEEILTIDNANKYPINNTDAGVIVITDKKTIKSNLHKMKHQKEFVSILSNLYGNKFKKEVSDYKEMCNYNNDILIQLCLGEIVVWVPEHINDYQINALKELEKEISVIDEELPSENKTKQSLCVCNKNFIKDCYSDISQFVNMYQNQNETVKNHLNNKKTISIL